MSWQFLLILSIIFLSCNGLFHRSLLKDDNSDPKAQTIVFLTLGGIITIFIALLRGKLQLEFSPVLIFNFLVLAIFATIGYVLRYRGFQLINASEIAIFASTSKFWNVIWAFIFLNEVITLPKVLGSIIILVGIAITMYVDKKFKINKGILLVLFAAILSGLTDINGYYILQSMDASSYQIYFYFLPVLALILVAPATVKKIPFYFRKDRAIKMAALSMFDALGMFTLFLAYQAGGQASVLGPLSATKIIVTVILAMIILKERDHIKNKLAGAVVTIIGIILLL